MTELTLYARQKQMIALLNGRHSIETGKSLAAALGISERTVRNDVREINRQLAPVGIEIIAHHGKGYTLDVRNRALYLELFSQRENYITKEDRIRTLTLRLLMEDGWYDLGRLEDSMLVSRTTLESDLRTVKKRISSRYPYLKISRRENAVRLEEDERKKRALLTRIYAENWDYDSKSGVVFRQDELDAYTLSRVQDEVKRMLTVEEIEMNDLCMIYLTLSTAILYVRVRNGHTICGEEPHMPDSSALAAATSLLDALRAEWGIVLSKEEYGWLAGILQQLKLVNLRDLSRSEAEKIAGPESCRIVSQILTQVYCDVQMDFSEDDVLYVDLLLHVQSLRNGIIAAQMQNHVYGDELRGRYPFLGDLVHNVRIRLEEWCEMDLWRDEEDCLLPMFVSAQRRMYAKRRGEGIPVAVVSHMNQGMSDFLMEQLRKYYGEVMDLRGPFPVFETEKIRLEEPMLILTTVQMKDFRRSYGVPVVTVSALIDENDRRQILPHLTDIKCKFLYPPLPCPVTDFLKPELICRLKEKDSLGAAISAVQDQLYLKKYMEEKIAVDLENDYYTVFPNGLVFLYQVDRYINESVLSLAELSRAVSQKHIRDITGILFLAVRPQDLKYLGWFYRFAGQLSENPGMVEELPGKPERSRK